MVSTELAEVFAIFYIREDIMIATDQHLVTVETRKSFHGPTIYHHISEMIYLVLWTHAVVPHPNKMFIHFRGIIPRSEFGAIITGESAYTSVTEMSVTH
jgi:hypothetical protein